MPQFAMTRVERLVERVPQIAGGYDAEGADGAQRTTLSTAERVIAASVVDVLAFNAARQTDVLHEDVSRIH